MNKNFENGKVKAEAAIQAKLRNRYDDKLLISTTVRDPDGQLYKLIEYIGDTANPGHSFSVVVDSDVSEHKKEFFFDGDGAFYLFGVDKKVTESK